MTRRIGPAILIALLAAAAGAPAATTVAAPAQAVAPIRQNVLPAPVFSATSSDTTAADDDSPPLRSVATNDDAQALLARAREYAQARQYREALLLLEHIMDRYADQRVRHGNGFYHDARLEVERMIRQWPAQALTLYRLNADIQVEAMLAGPIDQCRDKALLNQIFEHYFLCSWGDEVGYRLGCLCFDDGQFSRARQIFLKVLSHPDLADSASPGASAVHRHDLQWRLAICQASIGPMDQAQTLLDRLHAVHPLDRDRLALIRSTLDRRRRRLAGPGAPIGRLSTGVEVMAGLGSSGLSKPDGGWAVLWQHGFSMRIPNQTARGTYRSGEPVNRKAMILNWRQAGWFPAARPVFGDGRLWLRSHAGLLCLDATTGRQLWNYRQPIDAINGMVRPYRLNNITARPLPQQPQEVMAFGDRAIRAISWIDRTIYAIEGTPIVQTRYTAVRHNDQNKLVNYGPSQAVIALDADSGALRWRRYLGTEQNKTAQHIGSRILNAPVMVAGRLLVIFIEQNQLFASLLDPATGRPVGQPIYLALLPAGAIRWSPVGLLVEADDAYLADGQGMVLAINARAGRTEWIRMIGAGLDATDAAAGADRQARQPRFGRGMEIVDEQSLRQTEIFRAAGYLVVLDAASQTIYQLDPADGQLRLDPRTGRPLVIRDIAFAYALGVYGRDLILGDHRNLCRVNLRTGRIVWRASVNGSTGQAVLTENAIYAPVDKAILRIDPRTGKRLASKALLVDLDQPVGNLLSDGQHLLAVGMDRVMALVDAIPYLQSLTARFTDGDASALLERALLHRQMGQLDDAEADLRLALSQQADHPPDRVREELIDLLLTRAPSDPDQALSRLDEAAGLATSPSVCRRIAIARIQWLIRANRRAEAATMCLKMVIAGDGATVRLDESAGRWVVRADRWAGEQLHRLLTAGAEATVTDLAARQGGHAIDQARQAGDWQRLYDLAIALRDLPVGRQAGQALCQAVTDEDLGRREQAERFELAEALLGELARDDRSANAARDGVDLADLYEQMHWYRQAARQWRRQAQRYGDQVLRSGSAEPVPIATLARQRLDRLAALIPAGAGQLHPPFVKLWELPASTNQPIVMPAWRAADDEYLDRHQLVYNTQDRQLDWYRLDTPRRTDWSLKLPEDLNFVPRRSSWGYAVSGGTDGYRLIIRWGEQMLCVGAVSGRLLWQRRVNRQASTRIPDQPDLAERLSRNFDVGHGVVAEAVSADDGLSDALQVVESQTGRLLWQRALADQFVRHVKITDDYVIAFVDNASVALVFNRRTGKQIHRLALGASLTNSMALFTRRRMFYYANGHLICRRLNDGKIVWQRTEQSFRRLQRMNDDLLAVVWNNQILELLDLHTGKTRWRLLGDQVGKYIYDLALSPDGQRMYTFGRLADNTWAMVVTEVATGKRTMMLNTGRYASYRVPLGDVVRCGPLLPLVIRDGSSSHYRLCFYRRSDGRIEKTADLPMSNGGNRVANLRSSPLVSDGTILIQSDDRLLVFGSRPTDSPTAPPAAPTPATGAME